MRYLILCFSFLPFVFLPLSPARADAAPAYKGIWLATQYPSFSISGGQPIRLDINIHNTDEPPQRVNLTIPEKPDGWKAMLVGNDKPVNAVFVGPGDLANVQLRVTPPANVKSGTYHMVVAAHGTGQAFSLPLDITFGQVLPPKLTLTADFPSLKGTDSSTFKYKLTLRNDSGQQTLVSLNAQAPTGFEVSYQEQYGTQTLTSIPVKAGESKTLEAQVQLPQGTTAGTYKILALAEAKGVHAEAPLALQVEGRPDLSISTPGDLLNGEAYAGQQATIDLVVSNSGTAPAHDVKLSSFGPSGWNIKFDPKTIGLVPPNGQKQFKALITPSAKAIAGDYQVTFNSNADGAHNSDKFRITVRTSSMWGIIGVVVIAISLMVLVLSVIRYGRR